ncbi:MAG TPA: hypothetical protein P5514_12445 [Bacteroidales bacterium]|nr:hypothetical protein [Bacteroidales bacterium]
MINKNIIFVFVYLSIMTGACSVKRQAFSHVEVIKDSTFQSIDTSYHPGEVSIKIEQENTTGDQKLVLSVEAFNRMIDSLFADIDSTCKKEHFLQSITKTKGLWNSDTSFLETSLASSYAVVKNGKLSHYLHQKDTTLKRSFDSLVQVIDKEREIWHNKEVINSSETKTRSGFNLKLIVIIVIVIFLGWIIIKRLI